MSRPHLLIGSARRMEDYIAMRDGFIKKTISDFAEIHSIRKDVADYEASVDRLANWNRRNEDENNVSA